MIYTSEITMYNGGFLYEKGGKRVRWETKILSGRVSVKMYETVLDIVHEGNYADVTDYLRDLIRRDFDKREIIVEARAL